MIAFLKGIILHITSTYLILDINGVGYEVFAPARTLEILNKGDEAEFFVHTYVREDQIKLYGFAQLIERDMFNMLIGISGVGPKAALSILSSNTTTNIRQAISTADVNFFTKIKGLGKKTAQKVIIDLKTKLGSITELDLSEPENNNLQLFSQEIVMALENLGFVKKDIEQVLKTIDCTQSEAVIMRQAMQQLGRI